MILLLPGCCDTAAPIQNWLLREIEKYHLKRILCESLLKENWIKMILFWWIEEIYNCIVGPWAALLIHSTQISGCRMVDGPTTGPSSLQYSCQKLFLPDRILFKVQSNHGLWVKWTLEMFWNHGIFARLESAFTLFDGVTYCGYKIKLAK